MNPPSFRRNPLDPRNTPYAIRRSRPVKRIKVHRAGEKPESQEDVPSPDQSSHPTEDNMTPSKTQDATSNTIDQIEQQKNVDWQAQYARLQADLENTKKRVEKRYAQQSDDLRIRLLYDLLPLADHLESALTHSESEADDDTLRQGVALTLKAFLDTLAKYGVQVIDPAGEEFNPELHEAVGIVDDPDTPGGHVAKVMQRGYTIDGRVIRPARVLVAK